MDKDDFSWICEGIPDELPELRPLDRAIPHAPKRRGVLQGAERSQAIKNALRYFPAHLHGTLAEEFRDELDTYGHIYMYRYRPKQALRAGSLCDYPAKCSEAAAIMLMICNNLDPKVAQFPEELVTYGGNGSVFQNWAQFRLTMAYLSELRPDETLVLYSGHPLGVFPSRSEAPRVVVTNGMMIPNYSSKSDLERFNALGVTQYGQMTAGSFMYIGPQGIVHGTTITVLNGIRKCGASGKDRLPLFVSSGLGGMSGAQAKASVIAGTIGVVAEIDPAVIDKRLSQGWVDEVYSSLSQLIGRIEQLRAGSKPRSIAYAGNIVDLWEGLGEAGVAVDLGSDQTSLHNPFAGGYYPADLSFEKANEMMANDPDGFRASVQRSLIRQVDAINRLAERGMYFFDYGNAFLLEASRAGADVGGENGRFRYPSYVEDIMGPLCFDYGFGPFRWVCTSGDPRDLEATDQIAAQVIVELMDEEDDDHTRSQHQDNLKWIQEAGSNQLVVGSQARILYSDAKGRIRLGLAFNEAIRSGRLRGPVVLGRDHHDVSGTDSPYRETANIYDGSAFTADMAVHNFVGDAFRGASWVSLHNGGGVGWGEVINGGFGMVIDGSEESAGRITSMLHWDVNNGIARRAWAGNRGARHAITRAMEEEPALRVTLPAPVDGLLVESVISKS